jgi:polyhydroxyalkanoate synthase
MSQQPLPDPASLQRLQHASMRMVEDMLAHLPQARAGLGEFLLALAAHPQRVAEVNARHYSARLALWSGLMDQAAPAEAAPEIAATAADRRFRAGEWQRIAFFRFLRESYEADARWVGELIDALQLPPDLAQRARFLGKQFVAAIAPTNQFATNPEAIRRAFATGGASVGAGLHNLEHDLERGAISMSDERAFEVGRNIAVTPGAVVFENSIMQLIEYAPITAKVHARPLLIVPPFINKYYVLDLQPHNSFVRFALQQGQRVFMISWRNAGADLRQATWDDYARDGVHRALQAALEISRSRRVNALGFCVGGTLLASALAVMDTPERVSSITLLACLLDFSDVGEIGVFVDDEYVAACEREFENGGLMPGARIAGAFASLRPDELVWFFVVNNYLKGQDPAPFDLLYWNADSANVPGRLYAWYLRRMYRDNALREPGGVTVCGTPVDLRALRMPAYLLATKDDHIVPWRSAQASARLLAGTIECVLGASGHVAGVIAPPDARRGYWTNATASGNPDEWLRHARQHDGSWWEHWAAWIAPQSGTRKAAPGTAGSDAYPIIEPAPGRHVRERGVPTQ